MNQLMMLLGGATETLPGLLPPGGPGSNNGESIAISENDTTVPRSIVIGAPSTSAANETGLAHVYQWNGTVFSFFTTLSPVPAIPQMEFGAAVDISDDGTKIIVGAPGDVLTQESGRVFAYIWNGTGYDLEDVLDADAGGLGPEDGGRFGQTLSMDKAGLSFVGAAPNGQQILNQGLCYAFSYSAGWTEIVERIQESPTRQQAQFGTALDISEDGLQLVVTSPTPQSGNPRIVFFSRANTTTGFGAQDQTFTIISGVNGVSFDPAALITFVAGASTFFTMLLNGNWALEDSVTPDVTGSNFGIAIDANGTHVIVGATTILTSTGTISIYSYTGGGILTFVRTDNSPANQNFAEFGAAIAVANTAPEMAVGEPSLDRSVQFADEGNAYSLVI